MATSGGPHLLHSLHKEGLGLGESPRDTGEEQEELEEELDEELVLQVQHC